MEAGDTEDGMESALEAGELTSKLLWVVEMRLLSDWTEDDREAPKTEVEVDGVEWGLFGLYPEGNRFPDIRIRLRRGGS